MTTDGGGGAGAQTHPLTLFCAPPLLYCGLPNGNGASGTPSGPAGQRMRFFCFSVQGLSLETSFHLCGGET